MKLSNFDFKLAVKGLLAVPVVILVLPVVLSGGLLVYLGIDSYRKKSKQYNKVKNAVIYHDFEKLREDFTVIEENTEPKTIFVSGIIQKDGLNELCAKENKEVAISGPARRYAAIYWQKEFVGKIKKWRVSVSHVLCNTSSSVPFLLKDYNSRTITISEIHDATYFDDLMLSKHEVYKHTEPVPQYSTTLDIGSRITKYDIGKETNEYLLQFGSPITIYGHIAAITEDSLVISPQIVGVSASDIIDKQTHSFDSSDLLLVISGVFIILFFTTQSLQLFKF